MDGMLRAIDALNEGVGRAAAWLTLGMVVVTFGVVVARYAFGVGGIAVQESITWMHATVLMLGAGYTLKHDEHVRVDLFLRGFSPRGKALVELGGTLLLLVPVCALVLWMSLDYVLISWRIGESSRETGGLGAIYLLKTVMPVAVLLLMLQGLARAARALRVLRGEG